MKRSVVAAFLRIVFFLFMASIFSVLSLAVAGEHPRHPASPGVQIHTSTVDGYGFDYTLYDFPERKIQHLMVSFKGPEGTDLEQGKVGFLVTGPDGSKQKGMAMGMKNAYGADMDFSQKGIYTIKTKAVFGDKKLFDQFNYEVK
ncbi:MAG TPA: hypothetical protein HPP90_12380 [Deltaproteobacteria bacterium]|nr:hypothetical protein [Deltaproteobacteria bacterium]